jgi:hypothetical protein
LSQTPLRSTAAGRNTPPLPKRPINIASNVLSFHKITEQLD